MLNLGHFPEEQRLDILSKVHPDRLRRFCVYLVALLHQRRLAYPVAELVELSSHYGLAITALQHMARAENPQARKSLALMRL